MSSDRVRYQLKRLIADADALRARLESMSEGVRYARTPEKLHELCGELGEARECLRTALDILHGRQPAPPAPTPAGPQGLGWLRQRVAGISRALMARGEEEMGEPGQERLAPAPRLGGFQGDSWSIPLPDIIGLLQGQSKTGELVAELEHETARLEFDNGELVAAFSDKTPSGQRLGEILVEMGALDEERLRAFLNCFSSSRVRLGEALMRGELVDRGVLRRAVERQVQLLFHRLTQAAYARYTFREGAVVPGSEESRLNVTHLLLESARHADESAA